MKKLMLELLVFGSLSFGVTTCNELTQNFKDFDVDVFLQKAGTRLRVTDFRKKWPNSLPAQQYGSVVAEYALLLFLYSHGGLDDSVLIEFYGRSLQGGETQLYELLTRMNDSKLIGSFDVNLELHLTKKLVKKLNKKYYEEGLSIRYKILFGLLRAARRIDCWVDSFK